MSRTRRPVRAHIWRRVSKYQAHHRQNGRCVYCQSPVSVIKSTVEHVVPRSLGGSDDPSNIAAACEPCNKLKGSMPERRFRKFLRNPEQAPGDRIEWLLANAGLRISARAKLACERIQKVAR